MRLKQSIPIRSPRVKFTSATLPAAEVVRGAILLAAVTMFPVFAGAQVKHQPEAASAGQLRNTGSGSRPAEMQNLASPGHLPVKRVVLYKNGVGYFEHTGQVHGDQDLSIDFTTAQLNDVLKSMTVLDLGNGRITGVRYNSIAPLSQRLRALHLPFSEQTTRADFFWALRGARVEVRRGAATSFGRLLSVERVKKQNPGSYEITEVTQISVMSASGELRSYELTPEVLVRIAEPELNGDIGRYLNLLESGRTEDLRRMTISTAGEGSRNLFVSYISEVPVWKSTYRILLPASEKEKALLQGWAIVDNTVGEDWKNVQLSLVAGEPQSFIQQISQPYYARRPVVALPHSVMLTPQTHEGSMAGGAADSSSPGNVHGVAMDPTGAIIPNAKVTIRNQDTGAEQMTTTNASGLYSFQNAAPGNNTLFAEAPGFGRFSSGAFYLNTGKDYQIDPKLAIATTAQSIEVTAGSSVISTAQSSSSVRLSGPAPKPQPAEPATTIAALAAKVEPQALGLQVGSLFEYNINQKITIGKDQSALVPIMQSRIEAEKVTLWNDSGSYPLRALWIHNTSGLTLDGGAFNVVDADTFAGEGMLDEIGPGEKRIISYAVDPAVRISAKQESSDRPVTKVHVAGGVMKMTREQRESKTYLVHNADTSARSVILEYPVRANWKLVEGITPEESSASFHRFRVAVAGGKTSQFVVEETQPLEMTYQITEFSEEQVTLFASQKTITPEMERVFREVLVRKAKIAQLEEQAGQREQEIETIGKDQARLRQNMEALKSSAEEKGLLRRYTGQLNSEEDRLSTLQKEIADLKAKSGAAQNELDKMLEKVTLDETF